MCVARKNLAQVARKCLWAVAYSIDESLPTSHLPTERFPYSFPYLKTSEAAQVAQDKQTTFYNQTN